MEEKNELKMWVKKKRNDGNNNNYNDDGNDTWE